LDIFVANQSPHLPGIHSRVEVAEW
jgi:hypothetical protein